MRSTTDPEIPDAALRLGPDSLIWKFYGDHRTQFFGFQRVAGVENASNSSARGCSTTR